MMEKEKRCGVADVQCPFFMGTEDVFSGKKLFCESPVPESNLTLYFRKKQEYQKQLQIFCCEHYKKCEIYRMVMTRYED